uniref:Alanine--glyoxylate and serine--pyruvate aminotransferase n=1 Tax=Bubo bubo TaxID=30461 RepID=A0A8C0EG87_BUBBB
MHPEVLQVSCPSPDSSALLPSSPSTPTRGWNSSAGARGTTAVPAGPLPLQVMDEIKVGIQYAFQTQNQLTLAISGTGHCAMEAALLNLLEHGDTVLVAVNGIWGQRAVDIARRLGANVHELLKPPGEYFAPWDIEEGLARHKPSVLFITHGESSTGVLQPLEGLGELCHRSVHSGHPTRAGGTPRSLSGIGAWGFTCPGAGWAWGRGGRQEVPIDIRDLLLPLCPQGLESSWERHRANCTLLCQGLRDLGLELFVKEEARLPTITTVRVPEGYNWKEITAFLMDNHAIEIAGGLGPSAGKVGSVLLSRCLWPVSRELRTHTQTRPRTRL